MHMNNEAKKCNDKNPENNNGWRRTKDKLGWKEGRENGEEMTKTEGGQDKEIQKKAKHTEHFRGKWLKTDWQEKMDDDDAFEKDLHPIQFLFCFSSCDFFHPRISLWIVSLSHRLFAWIDRMLVFVVALMSTMTTVSFSVLLFPFYSARFNSSSMFRVPFKQSEQKESWENTQTAFAV